MNLKVFKQIKTYMRVWLCILRSAVKRSQLFKVDILFRLFRVVFILAMQIFILNTVFGSDNEYAGWEKIEAYLIMGIWNLLNYTGWSIFGVNLLNLESKVVDGRFDYILLKPISSFWFASFGDFFIHNFVTSLSGFVLIVYYLYIKWSTLEILNVILASIAVLSAFLIWYSLFLFFASFAISKPRNGFLSVSKELLGVTKYPITVFGEKLQIIFYTVIPIAYITTVPVSLLTGKSNYVLLLIAVAISIAIFILAKKNWYKNVKRYSSASS